MIKACKLKTCKYLILLIAGISVLLLDGCKTAEYSALHSPKKPAEKDTAFSILSGPEKPGEKDVTLITAGHNRPGTIVRIEQIDHEQITDTGYKNRAEYKLAPGRHTVFYYFLNQRHSLFISSADLNISFSAKPGHFYELKNFIQWDDEFPEKVGTVDFLTMVTDTTDGEVVAWESRGRGDFKKEVQSKTGLRLTDRTEKNAFKTGCPDTAVLSTGCKAVFPDLAGGGSKYGLHRAVFLDFVYKGNPYGIYFTANRVVYEKLLSVSRSQVYGNGKEKLTKIDFIMPRLDNQVQRKNLLPLVEKIRSLTPDVHVQARIAISMVQNIRYTNVAYMEKYPYGVIWEHGGACSEKSDLLLFLLRELGFGTATLVYRHQNHRAVGIKCPDEYDVDDSGYCYVEVTSPAIITDNMSFGGAGALTDPDVIRISDGIGIEGIDEEFTDKNLYYGLLKKAKDENGVLGQNDYDLYSSILNKYGILKN